MKKPLIVFPVVSLLVCVIVSFGFSMPVKKKKNHQTPATGFALVELFTSEGCSSCPPADKVVAALAKDYPANAIVLGFHVDYWNYLGWKDEYSSADYSDRQQQYAAAFALNSIYTPQVIVNGKTQFTGSDKTSLYNTVEKELTVPGVAVIDFSAKTANANNLLVTYKTNADDKSRVCFALVQLQAVSAVQRGENKGLLLHHIDVVRSFKTADNRAGTVNLVIPAGLQAKDCKLVAFVQHKSDMHIIGAAAIALQ